MSGWRLFRARREYVPTVTLLGPPVTPPPPTGHVIYPPAEQLAALRAAFMAGWLARRPEGFEATRRNSPDELETAWARWIGTR